MKEEGEKERLHKILLVGEDAVDVFGITSNITML
jgi:hypothetical protein